MSVDGIVHFEVDPTAAKKKAHEIFISRRANGEQVFNTWKAGWMKCPDRVREQAEYDFTNSTFSSECPEFYAEFPNPEVAKAQLDKLNERIMSINMLIDSINKEGLERLKEYNALYGGQA